MVKWFLSGLLIVSGWVAADEALDWAVRDLMHDDENRRTAAVKKLQEHEQGVGKLLYQHFFTTHSDDEIKRLLAQLGAESFKDRRVATDQLIAIGAPCKEAVATTLEASKDPEVRVRCAKILKAIKPTHDALRPAGIIAALRVFIGRKTEPANQYAKAFVDEFLESLVAIDTATRDFVNEFCGWIRTDTSRAEDLAALLPKLKDQKLFNAYFDALAEMDKPLSIAALMPLRNRGVARERKQLLEDAEADLWRSRKAFLELVKTLEENDRLKAKNILYSKEFEQLYKEDVDVFLNSKNYNAKALGLQLAKKNPTPHKQTILDAISGISSTWNSTEFAEVLTQYPPEFFTGHVPLLFSVENADVVEFGLEMIADDPEPFLPALEAALMGKHPAAVGVLTSFYEKHFPKRIKQMHGILIKRIRSTTEKENQLFVELAQALKDTGYSENDLADFWQQRVNDQTFKHWESPLGQAVDGLNIPRKLVMKNLDKIFLQQDEVLYLLDTADQELRTQVLEKLSELMLTKPHYGTPALRVIADEAPDFLVTKFDPLVTSLLNSIKKKPRTFGYISGGLAWAVSKIPQLTERVVALIQSNDPVTKALGFRLAAEGVAPETRELLRKAVEGRKLEVPENEKWAKYYVLAFLINELERSSIYALIPAMITQERYELDRHVFLFNSADKNALPILEEQLPSFDPEQKLTALKLMLAIDPANDTAIKELQTLVLNGKPEPAANALRLLAFFRVPIQVSDERLELLASSKESVWGLVKAASHNKNLADQASPFLIKHLDVHLQRHTNCSGLVWRQKHLQKQFVPPLLDYLKSDNHKKQEFASDILASCSEALPGFVDEVNQIFTSLHDRDIIENMLWAIANIGPAAAPIAPHIKPYTSHKNEKIRLRSHFALARILPDRRARHEHARILLSEYDKVDEEHKSGIVRMLGLVRDFPDELHPFFRKALLDEDHGDNIRTQAVWALGRIKPYSPFVLETLEMALEQQLAKQQQAYWYGNILWVFAQDPKKCKSMLPFFDKASLSHRGSGNWFRNRRALIEGVPSG